MDQFNVQNAGVTLRVTSHGEGPTMLLLHGWPDTGDMWREVVPTFVAAGYRVVTVDLRGCGQSSKPTDVGDYAMMHLVGDVSCVIDALGEPVILVGHDWGASLAWVVASLLPDKVSKLVTMSVGHPTAFRSAGLSQQMKSWYMLLFGMPDIGEAFLRHNDYEVLRTWSRHPRADEVIAELERDGQMTTHLNWYRANVPPTAFLSEPPTLPPITMPAMGLWSTGDVFLGEEQMVNSEEFCDNGFQYVRLNNLGHWMILEEPTVVTGEIVKFLTQ